MNNIIWVGAMVVAAATGAGLAQFRTPADTAFAQVVRVTPLIEPIEQPGDGFLVANGVDRTRWYNVQYHIGDQTGFVRMDHDPGDRIPVQNGRMSVSAARTIDVSDH
jgi:uncharacterized protein YcfJ